MPRQGIADPTPETWVRHTDDDPRGHFLFAHGRTGGWRFWQRFDGDTEWTEDEMAIIDAVMHRCCYVDRARWTFRKFNFEAGGRVAKYDATAPKSDGPGFQSQTLEELAYRIEAHFIEIWLYGGLGTGHRHCDICQAEVQTRNVSFGMEMWELVPHYEAEHPDQIAKVRAEQLERMEGLRDFYRRRDGTYHVELDGSRDARTYIL